MTTFFTIFGASGDLAKLKIYPALFVLALRSKLPEDFVIVGYARSEYSHGDFFEIFSESVRKHTKDWGEYEEKILSSLKSRIHYIFAPYDSPEGFEKYKEYVYSAQEFRFLHTQEGQNPALITQEIEKITQVLYLSVPPGVVSPILLHFSKAFPEGERDIRVILEKPFGHDEISAKALLIELREYYRDDELYFLDHYMGKKSMRSLLALRSRNRIIDTMINPSEIARIEISALEDFSVRDRVGYFDSVGLIRDMIQSHLFEMLALLTLDLPSDTDPVSIAQARKSLIDKLVFDREQDRICLGQYASYRGDHEVTRDSLTETFVALSLHIDDPRWQDVPIYLRSGKSLESKRTTIVITFLPSVHAGSSDEPNRIILSLYPVEEISLRFLDESGDRRETHEIITRDSLAGDQESYLGSHELLFLDAIECERRFFLTPDEILASWRCIDRIFAHIADEKLTPEIYPNHSDGPKGQYKVLKDWYKVS